MDKRKAVVTEHGKLTPYEYGRGWKVHPKEGGYERARFLGTGLARTKAEGIKRLEFLAKRRAPRNTSFEPQLTLREKYEMELEPGYHLEECSGEAHSNPHIDNCMVCAPWWGYIAVKDR